MKILEITEYDLYGRSFNGYDIMGQINSSDGDTALMKALRKISTDSCVRPVFSLAGETALCDKLRNEEKTELNMMSVLSVSSPALYASKEYKAADIAHYHQFHNSNLGFFELEAQAKQKPTIVSFHDPWMLTGRCVHPRECEGFKTGCKNCERLDTLFDFKEDMSAAMWNIKKSFYTTADVDIIVHSDYMYRLAKENPYTKGSAIHLIPFGVDCNAFNLNESKAKSREILGVPESDFVLFFREQSDFKGTNYIVDALKHLENTENITLLTCSQMGLLEEIADRFSIIELGNIPIETVKRCYNACDVFLMPSTGESFGMMAVEAMASARPVVVFDNTALPSVTGAPEIGILVKDLDSYNLYEKIKHLIDNPQECIERGEKGREFVKAKYSVKRYNEQIAAVYKTAYERQKYKLNSPKITVPPAEPVSDVDVQKLTFILSGIFSRLFGKKLTDYAPFKKVAAKQCTARDINFENENVKNAVMAFNSLCYRLLSAKRPRLLLIRKTKSLFKRIKILLKTIAGKA